MPVPVGLYVHPILRRRSLTEVPPMNPLKAAYCRVFQICLRIALPFLPYRKPELLDHVTDIPALLTDKGLTKPLLVTDAFLHSSGLTASLEQALTLAGMKFEVFDRVCVNPTTDNITEAYNLYVSSECDCLIGFGGGSPIDCAKAIGAKAARPKKTFGQMSGILRIMKRTPFTIAIPTTAGTGSETTLAAVVTDAETRHKYAIMDFPLIPDYAVLDPLLTVSLPPKMTSTTGMDALTHATEAFIGRSTTKETRAEALEAVRLIFANIETAYNEGDNLEARSNMLHAAFLAGDAFSQSYVGYVHAIAHSLGGKYNIAHGLANAVLLPLVLEGYGSAVYPKLHQLAVAAGIATADESDETAAKRYIGEIRRLNHDMNIPETLPGIRKEDIPEMARYAEKEANPLYPVPVLWTQEQLVPYYYMVMEESYDR